MHAPADHHLSIADLAAAGLRLSPAEAVTITRELTLRAHAGDLPGIPSSTVLRFTSDGGIVCEGPVVAGQSVERAGRLLESLLPGFDAPPELRVPGALRLVVARALGTLDLPAYSTLDEFADALARFTAGDPQTVIRALVGTWRGVVDGAAPEPADEGGDGTESVDLTISDVRRARRSTGLRLADIAERSRIPVSLLRELEWGYFVNWPDGQYGRSQLVRYARAAGLDVEVVTRAVWPVLSEAVRARGAQPAQPAFIDGAVLGEVTEERDDRHAAAPAVGTSLVALGSAVPVTSAVAPRRRLWLAALAIPALIAIGLLPAAWQSSAGSRGAEPAATEALAANSSPAPQPEVRPDTTPAAPAPAAALSAAAPPADAAPPVAARPEAAGPAVANGPAVATGAETIVQTPRPPPPTQSRPPAAAAVPALATARPADLRGDTAFSPAFASVGSAMFYHADAGDRSAIMRADTDTTGAVLRVTSIVDDEARNFHARPSPDGERIAFDSDRDGERAVYVADATGRNVRRVSGEGFAAVPSWSPDGRTLAFVRAEADRPRVWNLWTVDLDTGKSRRLTSYRVGQPWGAAWFPDGRQIAYSHEERLIIRSLEDGKERVFKTPRKGRLVRTPAVSPDGRRVMFQVYKDGAWLLDLSNGSMRRVLTDPTAEEFTWSPDGRRVAYHSRKAGGWGVWIMAAR